MQFRPLFKLSEGYERYNSKGRGGDMSIDDPVSGIKIAASLMSSDRKGQGTFPLAVMCDESVPAEEILHFFTDGGVVRYPDSGIRNVQSSPSTIIFFDTFEAREHAVRTYDKKSLRPLEGHPLKLHLQCIELEGSQVSITCAVHVSV